MDLGLGPLYRYSVTLQLWELLASKGTCIEAHNRTPIDTSSISLSPKALSAAEDSSTEEKTGNSVKLSRARPSPIGNRYVYMVSRYLRFGWSALQSPSFTYQV